MGTGFEQVHAQLRYSKYALQHALSESAPIGWQAEVSTDCRIWVKQAIMTGKLNPYANGGVQGDLTFA